MRTFTAMVFASLALAGCSGGDGDAREPLPEDWRGRDLREPGWANETIQPGWTLGLRYDWGSGQRIAWDWFAFETIYVHFQVLRTEGGENRPLVTYDRFEDRGERHVVQPGAHEVDWLNESPYPVKIAYKVPAGGARVLHAPGEGPGCVLGPPPGLGQTPFAC